MRAIHEYLIIDGIHLLLHEPNNIVQVLRLLAIGGCAAGLILIFQCLVVVLAQCRKLSRVVLAA